uniref:Chromosome 2 open reading frame 92 n=1 Tax=Moschus moschiferus TaxID=68415 RepID=A0A8C6CXL4_MOSMO
KRGAETLFFVLFWIQGYPPRKSSRETDFALSSNKRDEHLAKLFDEILLQVFSKVPLEEMRAASFRSITKRDTKERAAVNGNSHEPEVFFDSTDRMSNNDHIAEDQRDQEYSLFNRDVSDTQATTINKGTLQEAVSPGVPSRGMVCSQLLHFLQKNIIIAAVSVVGIVMATGLLLLALVTYIRKKQSLHSPADMTYNIFIMNGKTWWQKSQDKKTKKHAGKQKQLKLNSGI